MGPSAILSVLVNADTTQAADKLTKFDRQLAAVNDVSRKGIEARLGASYNPEAFKRYEDALTKASDRAKNRAAFKAELGANYNNTAFNAYERGLTHAETVTKEKTGKIGSHFHGLTGPIDNVTGKLGKMAGALVAVGAAYAGLEGAKNAIDTTLELGHNTEKLTAATSLDTRTASTWLETAKARGISATSVTRSFIGLDKSIRTANEGSKTSKKVFDELGVSHKTLASGNTAKIMDDVAEGLKKQKDPAERAALAQTLFGRATQGLLPIFKDGKKGIDDALSTTQKYGDYLKNDGAKSFKGAIDAQRGIGQAGAGLKIAFTEAVLPTLVNVAKGVLGFITQMRSGKGAGGEFAAAMKTAFGYIKQAVDLVSDAIGFLIQHWPQIKAAAEPIIAWLIQAWQDAVKWLTGAFDTVAPKVSAVFNAIVKLITPVIAAIINGFKSLGPTIAPFLDSVAGVVSTAFDVIKAVITPIAKVVIPIVADAFKTAWDDIKVIVGAIVGVIKGAFQIMKGVIEVFTGLFSLDFGKMWQGIKDIFSGAVKAVIAILKAAGGLFINAGKFLINGLSDGITAAWGVLKGIFSGLPGDLLDIIKGAWQGMYDAGKFIIGGLQSGFEAAFNAVMGVLVGFLNDIIDVINKIPGVHIGHVTAPHLGASAPAGSAAVGNLHKAGFASGGMVTQPGYFAGEEAPRHPEVILATNPAYRQRNLGLFAQAGHMLGVPGFAGGGIFSGQPNLSQSQLGQLWVAGGGAPNVAGLMAAIAMAESGGRDVMQQGQPFATTGWGYWQITPGGSQYLDPLTNAREAVAKFSAAGGPTPWTTYTSGAYKQFLLGGGGLSNLISGAASSIAGAAGAGLGALEGLLPKAPNLPKWISGLPGYLLGKAGSFIKNQVGSFITAGAPPGGGLGLGGPGVGGGAGLGLFDGIPVASWIIPELVYAQSHGWRGQITSGYRPGYDPHAPSGSEHALVTYPGGAVDFGGMQDPAGLANKLAFMNATAGYRGQRLLPASGFRDDGHMSGTGHRRGGIHGLVRRFAKGGVFTQTGNATGMSGFRGLAGVTRPGSTTVPNRLIPTAPLSALGAITGMPGLPTIRGAIPNTAAGAGQIQGQIRDLTGQISGWESDYSTLSGYYNLNTDPLVDPVTGELNTAVINRKVGELNRLIAIRLEIFNAWQMIIALTQRLVASNRAIVDRFKTALAAINTKGLKGKALTAAQAQQAADRAAISTYSANAATALSNLTAAGGSRDNAWLTLLTDRNTLAGITGTVATPVAAATTAATGTTDTTALLQQIATTAQQNYAVSQAQYAALQSTPPFGGSFATGGVVPGPQGAPRVIIAHGGENVGGTPSVHLHFASGMEWLREFVNIEVQNSTRGTSVGAMRIAGLPGSRGGL